jgi:hypothetical protein
MNNVRLKTPRVFFLLSLLYFIPIMIPYLVYEVFHILPVPLYNCNFLGCFNPVGLLVAAWQWIFPVIGFVAILLNFLRELLTPTIARNQKVVLGLSAILFSGLLVCSYLLSQSTRLSLLPNGSPVFVLLLPAVITTFFYIVAIRNFAKRGVV